MNYEQIFDESYERSMAHERNGEDFFSAFYVRFLTSSPEISSKFANTDMPRQQGMLKKSFYSLLTFYASNHTDHYLEQIAVRHDHAHLDIAPALYDLWLETLVANVAEFDPQFSDRVELAWRLVMAPGITYMKFNYQR